MMKKIREVKIENESYEYQFYKAENNYLFNLLLLHVSKTSAYHYTIRTFANIFLPKHKLN